MNLTPPPPLVEPGGEAPVSKPGDRPLRPSPTRDGFDTGASRPGSPGGRIAAAVVLVLALAAVALVAAPASAAPARLTNLAHLDFLQADVTPPTQARHSTYGAGAVTLPWTYADRNDDGTYRRVGGGTLDPATGDYTQGAFNSDDVSRTAVVYLRDWRQTGSASSRDTARDVLRGLAYFQTTTGAHAGDVVLWMQQDGELNPSAEPVELPDPSDSGPSYWLARTIWAYGEGYAAFRDSDPAFASFLANRMDLALAALNREVLVRYGQWTVSDGVRVPSWLIVDGADASAEAVLGLAAYVAARPDATVARTALRQLAEGVAAMSSGDRRTWPYGAILPWTHATTLWHGYASQMPAGLAAASAVLGDRGLLAPAVADATTFTPQLLAAGGPDNGWSPAPVDRTQIAYGVDSRLQSLLAVADRTGSAGIASLAALDGSWYFGTNASGTPIYDPATGVTFDGVAAGGTANRNSGAESTIHGLLSMLALDAHPAVAAQARALTRVDARDGLRVIEAEAASPTSGTVTPIDPAYTGESQYSGGAALTLQRGRSAAWRLAAARGARWIEPVLWLDPTARSTSLWTAGRLPLGVVSDRAGAQGVSAVPGVLRPERLTLPAPASATTVTARALGGTTTADALIVRPVVASLQYSGSARMGMLVSSALAPQRVAVSGIASVYRADGTPRSTGRGSVVLWPGDFAIVTG